MWLADRRRFFHAVQAAPSGALESVKTQLISQNMHSCYDGQVHTTSSDGERTPKEVAFEAYSQNLRIAVTDHYTTCGAVQALKELENLKRVYGENDSQIIGGVEFSIRLDKKEFGRVNKLHLLGLGVDLGKKHIMRWVKKFKKSRADDIECAVSIMEDLEDRGVEFDDGTIDRLRVYRNVYKALAKSMMSEVNILPVKRCLGVKLNEKRGRYKSKAKHRLKIEKQLVQAIRDIYGDFGATKPYIEEAVEVIEKSDGLVCVPHIARTQKFVPYLTESKLSRLLQNLKYHGVQAIEAYHPGHALETADRLAKAAVLNGLMVSAGSDNHLKVYPLCRYAR